MDRLIDFQLGDATQVLVEAADESTPVGPQQISAAGNVIEKANEAFDDAIAKIKPIARSLITQLREAVADASEIEVEFGIKLTAEAGVVLAKTAAEGHCKIAIKWKRP